MSSTSYEQIVEERKSEISFPKLYGIYPASLVHGRLISTKVVGVTFENRQEVVARLKMGDRVWLEREPDNPADYNAIKVCRSNGEQFGYVNHHLAANVAPYFDAYNKPVKGKVHLLTGSARDGYTLGVVIIFKLPKLLKNHRLHYHQIDDWED